MWQAAQFLILTAFQNNIEIFSLVSFLKQIVTFALTGVKYGWRHKTIVLYFKWEITESNRVPKWWHHKNEICEIMGFVKIFWKNNVQDAYSPKN